MATPTITVDVREMLCAQALAVVAQRLGSLQAGQTAAVRYSTDDVQRDLLTWARDRGYSADVAAPGTLQMQIGAR